VHKFPYICVCIGLVVNKKPLVGVVYAPLLDEMYTRHLSSMMLCSPDWVACVLCVCVCVAF
jgi:fructose-1,6-bisphosphatase/inositol monophosphatase family enzyme